jgi:hypothetical protein
MSVDPTDCPECSGFHPGVDCQAEEEQPDDEEGYEGPLCNGYSPDTYCGSCPDCVEALQEEEELYGERV